MTERKIRANTRQWEADITCLPIDVAANGVNAIAALVAVAGQRVYVHGLTLVPAAAVTLTIEDTDGTNLFGPVDLAAKAILSLPVSQLPHLFTASGKGLQILLGSAVQVGGSMLTAKY